VLDVNGLLIERSMAALCDVHNVPVEADQRVGAFHIYNRPGLHAFVRMLLDRFVVGVWSSARQHNLRGMVRHIFGAYEDRLAFVWGQEACSYAGTSAKKKPLFLKELGRLWTEPAFAPFGPHNTLLVDDDAYKAARNPPHTAIHPAKVRRAARAGWRSLSRSGQLARADATPACALQFLWQAGDDDALLEGGALWDYLLRLSTECTVCEWVQQHPFEVAPLPADQGGEGDSAAATRSAQQRTDAHSGASGGGTAV
jgi:hypothetical protein